MGYLVTIQEFGEGVPLHTVKKNFQVNVNPVTVFASKVTTVNPVPPPMVDADRASVNNVVPNVFGSAGLCEEIDQLCAEGIEMDDNHEPLLEDAAPAPTNPVGMRYEYTVPTFCPRQANNNIINSPGRWVQYWWDKIAEKSKLDLFRICFPEDFVHEAVLPTTNIHLFPHLTMQEFYKWLGCHFFMACFQGIDNQDERWLQQPISMFKGAPFRLSKFMTRNCFTDITCNIRFTNKETPTVASNGFVDWFHNVRQMLDPFNNHYNQNYVAS